MTLVGLLASTSAPAADPPLICFGNEPSWSVRLESPDTARLLSPGDATIEYRGAATRNDPLKERIWRGRPVTSSGGDLVVFLREATCSDGMSDTEHPVTARVSLADGRFLAGCCRVVAEPAAFERTTWRLVELPGVAPATLQALRSAPNARFEAGRVAGHAGCNNFTGSYTLDGDRLTLGQLAGTMMACVGEAMEVERAFHAAFTGPHRMAITGDRLTLTSEDERVVVFRAEAPPTLAGGTWTVTGYNNGRQAVVSPVSGTTLTLEFGTDGSLAGSAGCNRYRTTWTAEGDRLTIGPAAATSRKMCAPEVMEQERAFLASLATVTTWTIDARGMLDAHRADGERALTATRQPEP